MVEWLDEVVVLLLFVSQPAVLSSFWEVFGREEITEECTWDWRTLF